MVDLICQALLYVNVLSIIKQHEMEIFHIYSTQKMISEALRNLTSEPDFNDHKQHKTSFINLGFSLDF